MIIEEQIVRKIITEALSKPSSHDLMILEQAMKSAFGGIFKPLTDFYTKINQKGESLASKVYDKLLGALEDSMRMNQIAGDGNLNLKGNPEHRSFYINTLGEQVVKLLEQALNLLREAAKTKDWTPNSSEKSDVSSWQSTNGKSAEKLFTALGIMTEVSSQMKDFSPALEAVAASGRQINMPNDAAVWIDRFCLAMQDLSPIMKDSDIVTRGKIDQIVKVVKQIDQENESIKSVMADSAKEIAESLTTLIQTVRLSLNE